MGVGRREFLKLTGAALAGLAIDPLQAVVTHENVYINKSLGILFYKPDNWGFVNVKDFGKIKDEQILGNGLEEIKEKIWDELGDPICIATKYPYDLPEYKGIFSPTITLNITPKEEFGSSSFEQVIKMSQLGVTMLLKDFKVLKRHEPYAISGSRFYEFDSEYIFEHVDLNHHLKVELKTLKTEHNGIYYDFNCHQSFAQNQNAVKEFEEFKKTIKLI